MAKRGGGEEKQNNNGHGEMHAKSKNLSKIFWEEGVACAKLIESKESGAKEA